MNNSYIAISNISAINDRNVLRALTKGDSFDSGNLPNHVIWCDLDELQDKLQPRSNHDCDCDFRVERINCNLWRLNIRCENEEGEPFETFIFPSYGLGHFGQGFPFGPRIINGNGSYDFSTASLIQAGVPIHTPNVPSIRDEPFAEITIEYETVGCLDPKTKTVRLMIGATCDSRDADTGYLWMDDGSNQGFSYRTSTSKNFWGKNFENAEIWSKYKDSQGIWRDNNESFISAEVFAQRLDSKCNFEGLANGNAEVFDRDKQECHCNYRRARTRAEDDIIDPVTGQELPAYCGTGAVNGDYFKSYTWQGVLYEIEVDDNSLEFACCQAFGRN